MAKVSKEELKKRKEATLAALTNPEIRQSLTAGMSEKTAADFLEDMDSILFDLISEEEAEQQKARGKYVYPADKIHKSITAKRFPASGEMVVNLSGRAAKPAERAYLTVSLKEMGARLSEPITIEEKGVLFAVYSLIEAGYKWCTDVMLWRALTGDAKADPTPEQSKHIDDIMKKLAGVAITIKATNEAGRGYIKREVTSWEMLISVSGISEKKTYQNGTKARYFYRFKGVDNGRGGLSYEPILLQLAKDNLHQIARLNSEVLNIQKINKKTGELKALQKNPQRIAMVQELLDFCITYNRAKSGGKPFYKMNQRDYKSIFEACEITTTHQQQIARNKQYICDVLEHFKRNGLIKDYKTENDYIIIK